MILVTGGAGFIGSALLWRLNQDGHRDILVCDHLGQSDKWKNLRGKVFADYLEKDTLLELVEKNALKGDLEAVFHLGACSATTERDASYLLKNNYEFSKKLAEWTLRRDVPFYYASSAATYGEGDCGYVDEDRNTLRLTPLNMYGYSKLLFDHWIIRNKLTSRVVGLRYFNVYGPNEYHKGDMRSVVVKAFEQIQKEGQMRLFRSYRQDYKDGEQKRDFIYVKDAVAMMMEIYQKPNVRGIFNIGSGEARTWNDLAHALFRALGKKPAIEYTDMPEYLREKYQYFTQADLTKLRTAGVRHPLTSLEDAVKDYAAYLQTAAYL